MARLENKLICIVLLGVPMRESTAEQQSNQNDHTVAESAEEAESDSYVMNEIPQTNCYADTSTPLPQSRQAYHGSIDARRPSRTYLTSDNDEFLTRGLLFDSPILDNKQSIAGHNNETSV